MARWHPTPVGVDVQDMRRRGCTQMRRLGDFGRPPPSLGKGRRVGGTHMREMAACPHNSKERQRQQARRTEVLTRAAADARSRRIGWQRARVARACRG